MMNKIFLSVMLISVLSFSQTDWERWEAKEVSYRIPAPEKTKYRFDDSSIGDFILSSSRNGYKFLISDLDGDNCPFQPTCSVFFIEAVKQTNIFHGALMFADRFTRDLNLIKVKNQYTLTKDFHFFDPVNNYTLNPAKIKIIPASEVVDE
jgi:putative component of membrane protein insertase Oxa1/YidC/SpoIIIJ protein YidD